MMKLAIYSYRTRFTDEKSGLRQAKSLSGARRRFGRIVFLSMILSGWICGRIQAQDFSGIGKRKPFSLSGIVGGQTASRLATSGSDPFSYLISAQLNPVFYGISLPVSFSVADSRFSYAQPFSRLSFQPSYKWIKSYLGRTSMEMHPYGLAGHQFDGAGISLEPESFPLYFSAMYGRLCKAQPGDTLPADAPPAEGFQPPVYQRTGYAFKLGVLHKRQQFDLHFFRASDHRKSLNPERGDLPAPRENVVLALSFSFDLYQGLLLTGQAGLSAMTDDSRSRVEKKKGSFAGLSGLFMPQRVSTSLNTAYKIRLSYQGISIGYERVGPEYATLGAYYFDRDFENAVVSFTRSFSKVDVSADLGWQRDDLRNNKSGRMNRVVGSAYVNYRIDEKFSAMLSYSDFTVYTKLKPMDLSRPDDPLVQDPDTVAYRQVARQAQFGFNFSTAPEATWPQQAGLDISYQSSREKTQRLFSDYIYAAARHSIVLEGDYRLQTSVSFSTRIDRENRRQATFGYHMGPSVNCTRTLLEKTLSLSLGANYYFDMQGKSLSGGIAAIRFRGAYTLKKAHEFEMQLSGRLRSEFESGAGRGLREFYLQLAYRYRFALDPFAGKQKEKTAGKTHKRSEAFDEK